MLFVQIQIPIIYPPSQAAKSHLLSPSVLPGDCALPQNVSPTTTPLYKLSSHLAQHILSLQSRWSTLPIERSLIHPRAFKDKMCYKETLYHGKCGCYSKPQFVGEPCIRVAVDASLRSTGCWDVLDLGVKSTNTTCRRCEVAESLAESRQAVMSSSSSSASSSSWSERRSSVASSTSPAYSGRSAGSLSEISSMTSSSSEESKRSARAQACVSLSGMGSYKARRADGAIDRSTTAYMAYHETDGRFWTRESHKAAYVDTMYSKPPGKGRIAGLSSSQE